MNKKLLLTVLGVTGVVVLAAFLRLYDIHNYPPGLFPDEAANGEDALLILSGDTRPFYPRGNGREALFFYLQALSIKQFGIGFWQMHLVSALVGTLTVLAMYFATKPYFGRLAGLLTAFFLATSHWHITLSRTGFRAIMIPLFVAAFTAFVGYTITSVKKGKTTQSLLFAALAGAAFAGGFYTYIAYRVMVGVVGGIFALLLLAALHPNIGFPHLRRYGSQIVVAIIAAFITFAPLGWYFVQHPKDFVGRAGQVSIFSADLQREYGGGTLVGTLLYSTRETLRSFFVGEGDINWRHNVAGYPLLSPLVGLFFLLGLAWAIHGFIELIWKIVRGEEVHLGMIYPYHLLLLAGMLMPVITTAEGMPHGLRSIGLIAPIFILAGTAAAVVIRWVERRFAMEGPIALWRGVIAGLLALNLAYGVALYFYVARPSSAAAYAYRGDLVQVVEYVKNYRRQNPNAPRPYLVIDKFSVQTVHFFQHELNGNRSTPPPHEYTSHSDEDQHIYTQVDPEESHLTEVKPGEIIIFTQSTIPTDPTRFEEFQGSDVELVEVIENRFGDEIMRIYRAKGQPAVQGIEAFNLDA